jgi:hypothetical protein
MGSSNLPPGVTDAMIEEQAGANMPLECEECELFDDKAGTCPYQGKENACFKISLVKACAKCGKPIGLVEAAIPKEHIAHTYEMDFCCSIACAKDIQDKFDKQICEGHNLREPTIVLEQTYVSFNTQSMDKDKPEITAQFHFYTAYKE